MQSLQGFQEQLRKAGSAGIGHELPRVLRHPLSRHSQSLFRFVGGLWGPSALEWQPGVRAGAFMKFHEVWRNQGDHQEDVRTDGCHRIILAGRGAVSSLSSDSLSTCRGIQDQVAFEEPTLGGISLLVKPEACKPFHAANPARPGCI